MSDIEELQGRIMAAMDRMAQGIDGLGSSDAGQVTALQQSLDEEKQVNAQLTERVRVLGEKQEQAMAAMDAKAEEMQRRMAALDDELQRLRAANGMLSEACDALRDANAAGVGDPQLINKSMMAELDSIRAMRSAETAEAQEIIAALTPLLNASAAAGGNTEEAH